MQVNVLTILGHLRGLMIMADKRKKSKTPCFLLSGASKFQVFATESEVGTVVRLHNILDKVIPERISSLEKEIQDMEQEMVSSKETIGRPFPRAAELAEKKKRLDLLTKELDLDAQEQPEQQHGREDATRPGDLDSMIRAAKNRQALQCETVDQSRDTFGHSHT